MGQSAEGGDGTTIVMVELELEEAEAESRSRSRSRALFLLQWPLLYCKLCFGFKSQLKVHCKSKMENFFCRTVFREKGGWGTSISEHTVLASLTPWDCLCFICYLHKPAGGGSLYYLFPSSRLNTCFQFFNFPDLQELDHLFLLFRSWSL